MEDVQQQSGSWGPLLAVEILLMGGHHSVPWAPQDVVGTTAFRGHHGMPPTQTKKPLLGPGLLLPGPRLNIRHSCVAIVFLGDGGEDSSVHPRILLRTHGDIESNPGPSNIRRSTSNNISIKNICQNCREEVNLNRQHLKCENCESLCHRREACSGLTPRNKDTVWRCGRCQNNKINCSVCGDEVNTKRQHLKCSSCDALCHKKQQCSKMIGLDPTTAWSCINCATEPQAPIAITTLPETDTTSSPSQQVDTSASSSAQVPTTTSGAQHCKACSNKVYSNSNPLTCIECNAIVHPSCTNLNMSEINGARRTNSWKCVDCKSNCAVCKKSFNSRYQPFKCDINSCDKHVHKQTPCSGLNREKQREGKWKCWIHGGSKQPNRPTRPTSNNSGQCFSCSKLIKGNSNPLKCLACNVYSHAMIKCSDLNRWDADRHRKDNTWKCRNCINAGTQHTLPQLPTTQPQATQPQPETQEKVKCMKCSVTIRKNSRRLGCCECTSKCHLGCAGLTRDTVESFLTNNNWICDVCNIGNPNQNSLPNTIVDPMEKSEPKRTGTWRNLRILQWNADGINPKIGELKCFAQKEELDILLIQETKLTPKANTPTIRGYTAVRADRPNTQYPGGGLITYIKQDLAYRKVGSAFVDKTEILTISVQQKARKWVDISNIYIPPKCKVDLSWIPVSETAIIGGDINGHSTLWDHTQPSDEMGDEVLDFMLNKGLYCCNNGDPTRVNRGTGGVSTPDVTLVTNNLQNHFKWNITSKLGGSDHSPIIIEVDNGAYQRHHVRLRRKRWKRNKADWGSFYAEVEEKIGALDTKDQSLNSRVKVFTDILTKAGHTHVGKTLPKSNQDWMTSSVRAAVKKRNLLRRDIVNKRKEWLEACKEATELAKEAKEQAWREYLDEAEGDADPIRMWRTIKSLSGSPGGAAPNEAIIYQGKTLTTNAKKADAFADHYARVSKLQFSKEERSRNLEFKRKTKKK